MYHQLMVSHFHLLEDAFATLRERARDVNKLAIRRRSFDFGEEIDAFNGKRPLSSQLLRGLAHCSDLQSYLSHCL
jgi:hypothetical protein